MYHGLLRDGRYFYAADITGGGLDDRVRVDLAYDRPELALWLILLCHKLYAHATA